MTQQYVRDKLDELFRPKIDASTPASVVTAVEQNWEDLATAVAAGDAYGAALADGYIAFGTSIGIAGDNDFRYNRSNATVNITGSLLATSRDTGSSTIAIQGTGASMPYYSYAIGGTGVKGIGGTGDLYSGAEGGIGIHGVGPSLSSGWAGYFAGRVRIDGYETIQTGFTQNSIALDGTVGFGRAPQSIASVTPRAYILRRTGYWGLAIQGDVGNQADMLFQVPSAPANQRITQLTASTDGYFNIRSLSDAGSVVKSMITGDLNTGFIGMNDTTPSDQLDVAGTVRISAGTAPNWTTGGWARGICFPNSGYAIQWRRGTGTMSRGIGYTSDNNLYFIRSSADDASGVPTYDMLLDSNGDLSIGTGAAGAYRLDVMANVASFVCNLFNDGNNANRHGLRIQCGADNGVGQTFVLDVGDGDGTEIGYIEQTAGGVFQLVDVSDPRLKSDIAPTRVNGLSVLRGLNLIEYRFTRHGPDGLLNPIGFDADNCASVFPEMASTGLTGVRGVSRSALIPVLVKAIQELSERVEALEAQP